MPREFGYSLPTTIIFPMALFTGPTEGLLVLRLLGYFREAVLAVVQVSHTGAETHG
jgi:hypothetical protein